VSIKVMNLVWGSTLEGPSKRFALLALADRASDQGECSSLGVPTLCRKTGTMFGLLRDLEQQDRLIQREEQTRANGSRKASRIWINLPLLATMQHGADEHSADEPMNPSGDGRTNRAVGGAQEPRRAHRRRSGSASVRSLPQADRPDRRRGGRGVGSRCRRSGCARPPTPTAAR
jgi:hypothetical protein